MVTPDIEINLLHQRLVVIVVRRLQLLPDGALLTLDVEVLVLAVAQHIAENVDGE